MKKSSAWQTIREYAESHGMTTQAVYLKIKQGVLFTRTDAGKKMVSETPPEKGKKGGGAEKKGNDAVFEKMMLNAELQREKLKNLRADTALKAQKIIAQKEAMKREICEAVYQAYSESFDGFKSELIELKLNKAQLTKLTGSLKKCMGIFGEKLNEYIRRKEESPDDEESADESD